jgi:hypothetical protein
MGGVSVGKVVADHERFGASMNMLMQHPERLGTRNRDNLWTALDEEEIKCASFERFVDFHVGTLAYFFMWGAR